MVRHLWISFLVPLTVFGQQWSRLSDFPGSKRDDGAAAVLNGRAYFGTGLQEGWTSTSDWYSFDLYTLAWKKLPDMPPSTGRQYACGFSALNSIFIFGGDAYGGRNDMFRYDPVEEKWQGCAAKPGAGVMAAASMTFGDKVFFIGGKVHHDSLPTAEVWEYNATNDSWQRKADLPFDARWRAAATSLGGLGYLAGGIGAGDKILNDFLVYDPGTDSWQKQGDLPMAAPLRYSTLQPLTNKVVLFGGQDSSGVFSKSLWYFRPVQADWQPGPDLPAFGRRGGMSAGWNEKLVYVCGLGPGDTRLNEAWMLDLPLGETEKNKSLVTLYPNPCSQDAVIELPAPGFSVIVLRPDGRIVLKTSTREKSLVISAGTWSPGVYLVEVTDRQGNRNFARLLRR